MCHAKPLPADLPRTFAAIRDESRRGGLRFARVAVVENWPALRAAAVEEVRSRTPHVMPYARLCRRPAVHRARLAQFITFRVATEEAQSAVESPLAGKAVATR